MPVPNKNMFYLIKPMLMRNNLYSILSAIVSCSYLAAPLIVVSTDNGKLYTQYDKDHPLQLNNTSPKGWTNFFRSDDVCGTAYFYLNTPSDDLSGIQPLGLRVYNLFDNR